MSSKYDAVIIGGGFFGLSMAEYLKQNLKQNKVLVIEKEPTIMMRASYNNQARVHNGYHYPRSLLTAIRSRVNFSTFVKHYEDAVVNDFDNYYAVASTSSKVSARQFKLFCDRIGAETQQAPSHVKELFDKNLIDDVLKVKEFAFDADKLRKLMIERSDISGVKHQTDSEVVKVEPHPSGDVLVHLADSTVIRAGKVFNCTYSLINKINLASKLPVIRLKHELAEMALIKLPEEIKNLSVTVMCGPFFSFMPFPSKSLHTLSHVRYTPHSEWYDDSNVYKDGHRYVKTLNPVSNYKKMIADAGRYMPILAKSKYTESIWETKTVMPQSENDDSRPILFKSNHGIKNYTCVLGSKLDNVYDACKELDSLYA